MGVVSLDLEINLICSTMGQFITKRENALIFLQKDLHTYTEP